MTKKSKKVPKYMSKKLQAQLMLDIRAKKGKDYCCKKYKINVRNYYAYSSKVNKEDAEPTLLDTIQELQLNTINGWRLRVLQNIMKDEAALMHDDDISMKQRISIRQGILSTLTETAHSIALTDFQSNIGSEGSTIPSELMDALVESIPKEKRGAFIDELKNHTAARESAGEKETADRKA